MRGVVRQSFSFSFLVLAIAVSGPLQAETCSATIKSLDGLVREVDASLRQRQTDGRLKSATFFDHAADLEASKTWTGTTGPRLISDLLPAGVSLIDHTLMGATEPGVVKDSGSGEFLSLRLVKDGIGTNIGVSRSAILQNANRNDKSFVRSNAKAVIVFMHGGGTRTTGHHVAINLMNHFAALGVDVVSFDQAWHGEGPREIFKSPKEYFEWMRAWVKENIAVAGKPIFLAGHSMGGEFADAYMRLYPNDDLMTAIIALSTVIDPLPGASLREKISRMEAHDEAARSETSETPEDALLLHSLVTQNKLSFTAQLFEALFSAQTSWVIPDHGGKAYLPSLYVWGAKDWLLVGNERVVESHIRKLPNARVKIYDKRYDVVEKKDVDVGHIIFDHYKPGTEELEAFYDIREFIESVVGAKLTPEKAGSQSEDILKKVVQVYANNLAFRRFAETYVVHRKVANQELIQGVNARINELSQNAKPEQKDELNRLKMLRQGFWIPEGAEGDLGRQLKSEMDSLRKQKLSAKAERERYKKELENIRPQVKAHEEATRKILMERHSDALRGLEAESTQILSQLLALNDRISRAINAFYLSRLEAGDHNFVPTPEIQALIIEYEGLAQTYQGIQKRRDALISETSKGSENIFEVERNLRKNLQEAEEKFVDFEDGEAKLMILLTEKYSGGLFSYESMTLQDILNLPVEEWANYRTFVQDAWGRWQVLWRERPPSGKTSLY